MWWQLVAAPAARRDDAVALTKRNGDREIEIAATLEAVAVRRDHRLAKTLRLRELGNERDHVLDGHPSGIAERRSEQHCSGRSGAHQVRC